MAEWQPIETAPRKETIIVSDGGGIVALGYKARVRWYLGEYPTKWRTLLGFEPRWWMPDSTKENIFHIPFPDGGPSMAQRRINMEKLRAGQT